MCGSGLPSWGVVLRPLAISLVFVGACIATFACGDDTSMPDASIADAGIADAASSDARVGLDGALRDGATPRDGSMLDASAPITDFWLDGDWDMTEMSGAIVGDGFEFDNSEVTIVHDEDTVDFTTRTLTTELPGGATRTAEFAAASFGLAETRVLREGTAVGTLEDGVLSIEDCADVDNCKSMTIAWVSTDRLT